MSFGLLSRSKPGYNGAPLQPVSTIVVDGISKSPSRLSFSAFGEEEAAKPLHRKEDKLYELRLTRLPTQMNLHIHATCKTGCWQNGGVDYFLHCTGVFEYTCMLGYIVIYCSLTLLSLTSTSISNFLLYTTYVASA